jgi:hypothetical protein
MKVAWGLAARSGGARPGRSAVQRVVQPWMKGCLVNASLKSVLTQEFDLGTCYLVYPQLAVLHPRHALHAEAHIGDAGAGGGGALGLGIADEGVHCRPRSGCGGVLTPRVPLAEPVLGLSCLSNRFQTHRAPSGGPVGGI